MDIRILLFAVLAGVGGAITLWWVIMPLVAWFFNETQRAAEFKED